MSVPRATYRLQLRKEFTFSDAAAVVDYLKRLGISDLYTSPILRARPGSAHGYDIVDHSTLNPELGGKEAFEALSRALKAAGMGLIVDVVPNHMGVAGADNPAWLNVLEWGARAAHAGWFDIDWNPDCPYLRGKLLVPVLGDQFGVALESGKLRIKFDAEEGSFAVWAYDAHKLPVCPLHYRDILVACTGPVRELADLFAGIKPPLEQRAAELKRRLAALATHPDVREQIEQRTAALNGVEGDLGTWSRLAELIARQHWRAAHFRAAADDINYRRFFNINELAGVRMERQEVFEATHRLIFSLVDEARVSGLRIDHVDGLLDPKAYLSRLRKRLPDGAYLVIEKILAIHETLRTDWPVDGTTGYEFANLALGVLVDPAGAEPLRSFYKSFTGDAAPFAETARASKHRIMENELASELHMLSREVAAIAAQNPKTVDFTRNLVQRALKEVLACFPVYRTYLDEEAQATEADRRDIAWAVSVARKKETALDPSIFDFLQRLLLGELGDVHTSAALRCAMKVQQYSGPVMAKALEDTAFYRHTAFLALNEVGGDPEQFGVTVSAFHKFNQLRAESWPRSMLATSTHDTKRGEDARARLAVLSEMPDEWIKQVTVWSRVLRARRGDVEGAAPPDRRDEYALYQMLVATWPVELLDTWDSAPLAAYTQRLTAAMIKGVREAKIHSTWVQPNPDYENALTAFIADALDPNQGGGFRDVFLPFVAEVARAGAQNTLVQTVLKLTLPGVPDIYQGCELWDLSMVDPDNRRPVDFAARLELLKDIEAHPRPLGDYLGSWHDGRFKMAAIMRLLDCRKQSPCLFDKGSYIPLIVTGGDADRVIAFARVDGEEALMVLAARFPARAGVAAQAFEFAPPEGLAGRRWWDVLALGEVCLPMGLGAAGVRVLRSCP
ncbi:MAG: malto-oligosyltrehalose synthase [Rhodospirillaceae bacterium]